MREKLKIGRDEVYCLGKIAGVAIFASTITCVAFFLLNLLVLTEDRSVYRHRAAEAVTGGALAAQPHQNNCLILAELAMTPRGSHVQQAISPVVPPLVVPPDFRSKGLEKISVSGGFPQIEACYQLKSALSRPGGDAVFYHRYVHGHLTLASIGLLSFSFQTFVTVLLAVAVGLALVTLVLSVRTRSYGYAAMSATYLFASGVWRFGRTLDLGPAEILLSGWMLYCYLKPNRSTLAVAFFGALCMAFEFLTALLPSAVILMLGVAAIERRSFRGVSVELGTFATAAILTLLLKFAVVILLFPSDGVANLSETLMVHVGSGWQGAGQAMQSNRIFAAAFALAKMAYFSYLTSFGSLPLGVILTAILPAAFAVRAVRWRDYYFLAACVAVAAWVFLLVEHTVVNAGFMQRMLPWLTIIGIGIFVHVRSSKALPVSE